MYIHQLQEMNHSGGSNDSGEGFMCVGMGILYFLLNFTENPKQF